jgi:hypothetical protein
MITGKYIFKVNGEIVAEKENILTANGIDMINRYLSNSAADWAGTIAVGSLYTVSASTDTVLAYEISRSPVTLKSYSSASSVSASNQIILKATLDPLLVGQIYEIGVIPQNQVNVSKSDNLYLTEFDEIYGTSASSDWAVGSSSAATTKVALSASSRVGPYSISVPTASVATRSGFYTDISDFNTNDFLQLLYSVGASSTSPSLTITLTDTNGVTWATPAKLISTAATGYYSASFALSSSAGSNFNYNVDYISLAFSGGNGSVILDSLKLMSGSLKLSEEKLVSRSSSSAVLVTTKYGQPIDIEYYLTVT